MRLFNLILVFKSGVLVVVAADKNDSREIAQKKLEDIVEEFSKRFDKDIESWSGDVRIFKGFESVIDEILENGKASEVPIKIPILKIFKKDFEKSQKDIRKKGIVLKEVDLTSNIEKIEPPEWAKTKKLPKQVVSQGIISDKEFEIAHICDGFHTVEKIAEEVGIPETEIQSVIEKLDELELLKWVTIE